MWYFFKLRFQIADFFCLIFRPIFNIHEFIHNYYHITSNTSLTVQSVQKHIFFGDVLNFPETHSKDHLWVQGTHYIENPSTSLPKFDTKVTISAHTSQPLAKNAKAVSVHSQADITALCVCVLTDCGIPLYILVVFHELHSHQVYKTMSNP